MTNEIYKKLTQLQWLLHKQQMRHWAENGPMADTTRGQGRILAVLRLRDGISTKDMFYLLGVQVSSLNELLSKLEKNGYVTREPSEQDKRVILVRLTDKGKSEQPPQPLGLDDIFTCLSDEEQEDFGEYLDRVIAALHDKFGDDDAEMLEKCKNSGQCLATR
ncbi:MAG: MarR family transcriptional regulator [Dehalococcoidia bacterium]|nr:MarR family transcriptional regulator [Dehalococcoidia bacterium]